MCDDKASLDVNEVSPPTMSKLLKTYTIILRIICENLRVHFQYFPIYTDVKWDLWVRYTLENIENRLVNSIK